MHQYRALPLRLRGYQYYRYRKSRGITDSRTLRMMEIETALARMNFLLMRKMMRLNRT